MKNTSGDFRVLSLLGSEQVWLSLTFFFFFILSDDCNDLGPTTQSGLRAWKSEQSDVAVSSQEQHLTPSETTQGVRWKQAKVGKYRARRCSTLIYWPIADPPGKGTALRFLDRSVEQQLRSSAVHFIAFKPESVSVYCSDGVECGTLFLPTHAT